ncbi:Hairy/enhancer-of-split with YRPW motif protein 2 [Coniosporium tulheliwenetii]|uniref:Hairy/enhancer-of-split with YRPW motif protein 2 n=1 Tax=Coniosporium tulheliwenetii TaxID=3383036 RepID=A0ACC2Z602_9PEZI|nr:Hairy/enhancer-of-split with YRPW motif protein 2 [Cladosporium sp. JES 115]
MEYDTKTPQYSTGDKTSFAYISARDRWPVIITGGIDDVHRATGAAQDPETQREGKKIVEGLAKLKYELQHDRHLRWDRVEETWKLVLTRDSPMPDDGERDVAGYNKELKQLGNPKWFNVPWLYSECYLYRRMNTLFSMSSKWKNYDIFARQKMSTFRSSRPAVTELAARYKELVTQLESGTSETQSPEEREAADKLLFTEMCEICLWGNATDLSLLTNLSYEDIQKLQGSEARKASEKNIIVNDLAQAFEVLNKAKKAGKKERRVDIILDNAGFELFVDLILAGYLLSADLATEIVLHPKSIPWFVSDVVPKDFGDLLNALANPQAFYTTPSDDDKHAGKTPEPLSDKEADELSFLFQRWAGFHAEGQLAIRPNRFWTEGGSYWRLPKTAPELYEDLKESELVIFKGDLNYRKLTADAMWDPTTPFAEAIGPLGGKSGIRTLALRTSKADVIVGLPAGKDEELRATEGGGGDSGCRKWAWSGKWAVIQFCDGKS